MAVFSELASFHIYLYMLKHCQRHNGPEGWVHIASSYTNVDQISISESRLSTNINISSVSQINLNLKSWPRFNFVTSTKHQQQNTDQTSVSKSRLNFNFKSWPNLVLKVWTKVKLYDQTSASKSATNCCHYDPHHLHQQQ